MILILVILEVPFNDLCKSWFILYDGVGFVWESSESSSSRGMFMFSRTIDIEEP